MVDKTTAEMLAELRTAEAAIHGPDSQIAWVGEHEFARLAQKYVLQIGAALEAAELERSRLIGLLNAREPESKAIDDLYERVRRLCSSRDSAFNEAADWRLTVGEVMGIEDDRECYKLGRHDLRTFVAGLRALRDELKE